MSDVHVAEEKDNHCRYKVYRRVQILPKSAEVLSCSGHGLAEEAHDNAASVGIADLNVKEDLAGDLLEVPVNDERAKQLENKWDVR